MKKEEEFQATYKKYERSKCPDWAENPKNLIQKRKGKNWVRPTTFPGTKDEKRISNLAASVESGEISSSSSEQKFGQNKIIVIYSSSYDIKTIKNYLDPFINTNLNYISIISHLVSQPKNKYISKSEQIFNATDLSPITFGMILYPNPRGKISTISQISPGTAEIKIPKHVL